MDDKLARLLADLPAQFRAAMRAEVDFYIWRAAHKHGSFVEFARRLAEFVKASEPYADAYEAIRRDFPSALGRVNEMLLPIQREYFP